MSAISGIPTQNEINAALAQSAAAQLAVVNTLASLGSNSTTSANYSFADLLSAFQQTVPGTTNNAATPAQSAQDAFLSVEYAITQTLGSLLSGSSQDSSNTDIFSLVYPTGVSGNNGLFGSTNGAFLNGFTGSTSAEAAHYAVLNAQYAVNQALGSLTTSNTSSRS
jgi:hypothetical protein